MFYWDPKPEIFTIPYLNWKVVWYSLFFTLGFAIGFPLFVSILRRFFFNKPQYTESDILIPDQLHNWGETKRSILKNINLKIEQGVFGAISQKIRQVVCKSDCLEPNQTLARLYLDKELGEAVLGIYRKATLITDKLVIYMLIGTIVGARVGHFLFYENPSDYLEDPLEIFRVWEGGLASHGAAIGIIISLVLFSRRIRNMTRDLSSIRLLDFVCVPTAFAAFCIRIGNFFNQEILGTKTSLPWGVVFGHPKDYGFLGPRHPVQIYEALIYLCLFFLLFRLTFKQRILLTEGKLIGLFLMVVFGFRFLIEFLKVEQSHLLSLESTLNMGQILSVPLICLGIYYFFVWPKMTSKA
jgi:phosphatidylglycerol:prolipoprotein diacylglycerol transferase